jgi:hypothetical protein
MKQQNVGLVNLSGTFISNLFRIRWRLLAPNAEIARHTPAHNPLVGRFPQAFCKADLRLNR